MRVVTSTAAILMMAAVPAIAQTPKSDTKPAAPKATAAKAYKTPKTPWGDPDLSGIFTNNDESGIPLERPNQFDGKKLEDISDSELTDYLTKIGGKKLFFFDTCYSGAILGGKATGSAPNVDKFANELKAAENGVVVFTSSTGRELSQQGDDNSVFTAAVVEGLGGKAGRPDIPVITVTDLDGYVSRRVKELTHGNQKPMMAMPKTVEDFPISVRAR